MMNARGAGGGGTLKNMIMLVLAASTLVLGFRYSNLRARFLEESAIKTERSYLLQSAQEEAGGYKRQLQDSEDARQQCEANQEKQLKEKNDKIAELEKQKGEKDNKIKEHEKQRADLNKQIETLKSEKGAAQTDADAQRKEKDQKNTELEKLRKEKDELSKKLTEAAAAANAPKPVETKPAEAKPAAEDKKPAEAKPAAK